MTLKKIKQIANTPTTYLLLLIPLLVMAVFTTRASHDAGGGESRENSGEDALQEAAQDGKQDAFKNVSIRAQAAYVRDLKTGEELYAKNANQSLPLASLTKLMTALVSREMLEDFDVVSITEPALLKEGDNGLYKNERWRVEDILAFSLLTSSNDGVHALRETLEEKYNTDLLRIMNNKARNLKLSNTYFINETGLDESETLAGGYGSARDMASLLEYLYARHLKTFRYTGENELRFRSLDNKIHGASNTNPLVSSIPAPLISKTGYTELAGGNLTVVFEKEPLHPIAVVILGSTLEERTRDVEKLIWAATRQ